MERIKSFFRSFTSSKQPVKQSKFYTRKNRGITKSVKYPVYNPSVVDRGTAISNYAKEYEKHPYGICSECFENGITDNTHSAVDHYAPLQRERRYKNKQPIRINTYISPFICLDDHMKTKYQYDESLYETVWTNLSYCINQVLVRFPTLYNVYSKYPNAIYDREGPRIYRDDWRKFNYPQLKKIAQKLAKELLSNGIILRSVITHGINHGMQHYAETICYTIIRIYLDLTEWQNIYKNYAFDDILNEQGIYNCKEAAQHIINAILCGTTICKTVRIDKYLKDILQFVRTQK